MDQILIKDLLVRAVIGINDEERSHRWDLLINLVLYQYPDRALGAMQLRIASIMLRSASWCSILLDLFSDTPWRHWQRISRIWILRWRG